MRCIQETANSTRSHYSIMVSRDQTDANDDAMPCDSRHLNKTTHVVVSVCFSWVWCFLYLFIVGEIWRHSFREDFSRFSIIIISITLNYC